MPIVAKNKMSLSAVFLKFNAAITPKGIPTNQVAIITQKERSKVFPARSFSFVETNSPDVVVPISPFTKFFAQ